MPDGYAPALRRDGDDARGCGCAKCLPLKVVGTLRCAETKNLTELRRETSLHNADAFDSNR